MSPPDLDPLDADLDALLDAERRRPAVSPEVRDRVLARVCATLGLPGPGGGGPPRGGPGGGGGAAGAAGGSLLKPILLGLALGSVVAAGIVARPESAPGAPPRGDSPAIAMGASPEPGRAEQSALDGDAGIPISPPPPEPTAAPIASPAVSSSAGHDALLAAERRLLDEAQRALAGGRGAAALDALQRHADEFPRGRLCEERESLWICVLISSGRIDEARARAARFRRLYPGSLLLPAIESKLGTIP